MLRFVENATSRRSASKPRQKAEINQGYDAGNGVKSGEFDLRTVRLPRHVAVVEVEPDGGRRQEADPGADRDEKNDVVDDGSKAHGTASRLLKFEKKGLAQRDEMQKGRFGVNCGLRPDIWGKRGLARRCLLRGEASE